MSRPTAHDESVIRKAAEKAVPEIREWLRGDPVTDVQLIDDLMESIRYNYNGYERAKALEHRGYEPDAELVEILENVDLWGCERAAVAEWVKEFDVKPPFPVGTMVRTHAGDVGEITKHDETHGLATVFMESKGHVREGLGTHGYLIPWEKLKQVETVTA